MHLYYLKKKLKVTKIKMDYFYLDYAKEVAKDPEVVPVSFKPINSNEFNLAVKVMFNYSAESNAFAIWRAMYKETLPTITEVDLGEMNCCKVR